MLKSAFFLVGSMGNFLYQMASPKAFYRLTQPWLKWLGISALICIIAGSVWGLFFSPPDYQQGDAFRIIYLHVPAAFLSISLYTLMGFLALLVLVWQLKMAGILLGVVAQLGASMTFLALVTGSIWGKPMWGTWWVWDSRLTSELILLFLYLAILVSKSAFSSQAQGDKLIAILTLVGLIDLPIIHYSVYWWNSLHQGASLSLFAKPKIALSMLYPLVVMFAGFSLYCLWMILHKARNEILEREYRQSWVLSSIETGK